jgi:hypothetical protein
MDIALKAHSIVRDMPETHPSLGEATPKMKPQIRVRGAQGQNKNVRWI